jgi:hypothetical protein
MRTSGLLRTRTDADGTSLDPDGPTTLLLIDPHQPHQLSVRRNRRWGRALSSLRSGSLDEQLADGRAPERSGVLAARAQRLATSARQRELAQAWLNLLERASGPPAPRSSKVPLRRASIVACELEIRQLVALLSHPQPSSTRGAAMASRLLSDGTGPLFQPHHPAAMRLALREVIQQLDPASLW